MASQTVSHEGKEGEYLTVEHQHPVGWRKAEGASSMSESETAAISMALSGIQAITAVLMQREIDAPLDGKGCLRLGNITTTGLLEAVSCCAQLIEAQLTAGTHRAAKTF